MPDPTEPLPGPEELIDKAARALDVLAEHTFSGTTDPQLAGCDGDEEPCTCGMPVSDWTCHHVDVLARAGLLADPAQKAALEKAIRERDSLARRCAVRFENEQRLKAELERLREQNAALKRVRDDVDGLLVAALGPHAEPGGGGWYADVSQLIAERDQLKVQVEAQNQTLDLVRVQNDNAVKQVDAALGHRYHTPGVHYSVPHVAEMAAAELQQLQARVDAALVELLRGGQDARDVRRAAIGILQGQEDRRLARVYGEANPPADPEPTEATNG